MAPVAVVLFKVEGVALGLTGGSSREGDGGPWRVRAGAGPGKGVSGVQPSAGWWGSGGAPQGEGWGGGEAVILTFMTNQVFQGFSPFFDFLLAHPRNIAEKKE